MVWLYDNAICDNLKESLGEGNVTVINPEGAIDVIAQMKDDNINFPVIVLTRNGDYSLDSKRMNFTLAHTGIPVSIDPDTNKVYNERVLPISLSYNLTVLATNTADMDELMKELMFKYVHMFFLTIRLPYEESGRRKIRFGVALDLDKEIEQSSGSVEYIKSGTLYQSILSLRCEGCVLVTYTPHQLQHRGLEIISPLNESQAAPLEKEQERREIYNEVSKFRNNK